MTESTGKMQDYSDDSKFCLTKTRDGLALKDSHSYFHHVQLQMKLSHTDHCDFVVWGEEDVFIERILQNNDFLEESMAKATALFKQCVLPELLGRWYTKVPIETPQHMDVKSHVNDHDGQRQATS